MANIVQCEKHGLRYNADIQEGCVICRREAGGSPSTAAADPARSTRPAASSTPMGPALLVTGVLILGTTGVFFVTHSAIAGVARGFLAQDEGDLFAPGMPGFTSGGTYDGSVPYPDDASGEDYGDEYDGSEFDDD